MPAQGMQIILMISIFFVLGYFLMYRPQKKRSDHIKEMRSNIRTGDKVVTVGGIEGHITQVFEDAYEIETGTKGSRLIVLKQYINYVIHPKKDKNGNEIDPHISADGIEWNEMPGFEESNEEDVKEDSSKEEPSSDLDQKAQA